MKKLLLMFLVCLLITGTLAAGAYACEDCVDPLEECTPDNPCQELPYNVPVFGRNGQQAANARAYVVGRSCQNLYCNQEVRTAELTVTAKVAQWARLHLKARGWEWYVKKPGQYYADCMELLVQSNSDVSFRFTDFTNLEWVEGSENYGISTVNDSIQVEFAWTEPDKTPTEWYKPKQLPEKVEMIEDSRDLHRGITYKLWNRITVANCNSPGVYRTTGKVELTLLNQAPWVDDGGEYIDDQLPS